MPIGMCLPKFDIYPGTVARNCFKNHANLDALTFFQKKVLPVVWSEIHHARRNFISTGQFV